jgi:hypothetical protein
VDTGGASGVVQISWVANPFRADRFEAAWLPAAEAALDFGASSWAFFRSREDQLLFEQFAFFDDKLDFERYWFSEDISRARANAAGLFQVPVVPAWLGVVGAGSVEQARVEE